VPFPLGLSDWGKWEKIGVGRLKKAAHPQTRILLGGGPGFSFCPPFQKRSQVAYEPSEAAVNSYGANWAIL
jgi:hypothetical protein